MPEIKAGTASCKQQKSKFAPLTLDFTFKKAFANEQCKELLLFLLNTFLERVLKEPIKDVKIIFLDFDPDFGKGCDEVVQYISLSNELHPEVRYEMFRMVYVRLSKFRKTEEECKSDIDRLLFTFKNAHTLSKRPASFNKMVFRRIFDIARISNFTSEELMDYELEMKRFSDHENALAYAKKKGIGDGVAIGEARREALARVSCEQQKICSQKNILLPIYINIFIFFYKAIETF